VLLQLSSDLHAIDPKSLKTAAYPKHNWFFSRTQLYNRRGDRLRRCVWVSDFSRIEDTVSQMLTDCYIVILCRFVSSLLTSSLLLYIPCSASP